MLSSLKRISVKAVCVSVIMSLLLMLTAPLTSFAETQKNVDDITTTDLYKKLTNSQKQEFNELVQGENLSYQEQVILLKEHEKYNPSSSQTHIHPMWKTAILKEIIKITAGVLGEKTAADLSDFLFGWEGSLQSGIEHYLVKKCGWNKTAAYWYAKSVIFILF